MWASPLTTFLVCLLVACVYADYNSEAHKGMDCAARSFPRATLNGHIYELVYVKQTWTEALFLSSRDTCSNMPGHLVTIESKAENDFVSTFIRTKMPNSLKQDVGWKWVHIAGTDLGEEGVYRWAAGPNAGKAFWNRGPISGVFNAFRTGEPSNSRGDEHCAHLEAEGGHIWNDRACYKWDEAADFDNYADYYYVVEYEAPSQGLALNDKGWLPYLNGHYYEIVEDAATVGGQLTYANSESHALSQSYQNLRGYMAMVTSGHENDFVWGLLKSFHLSDGTYTDLRLGGTDLGIESHWTWDGIGVGRNVEFYRGVGPNGMSPVSAFHGFKKSPDQCKYEPNDYLGNEDCVELWFNAYIASKARCWNDSPCDHERAFLIEYGVDCNQNTACGTGAECKASFCQCAAGRYLKDGACVLVNPCETNNGGCGATTAATCSVAGGVAQCTCKAGHEKVSGVCKAINPCDTQNGGCGSQATTSCKYESPGVNSCSCKSGYVSPTKNGKDCIAWDRCKDGSHDCGDHSDCTYTMPAQFRCACKPNYASDTGKNCQAIDNCEKSPPVCKENSICRYISAGQHACTCEEGHTSEDGSDCEAIPPCTLEPKRCGQASTCRNTGDYTFECACWANYKSLTQDGTGCVPIDPCKEQPAICGANSVCAYEAPGKHTCACLTGFASELPDNSDCAPINKCKADIFPCGPNTLCTATGPATYLCECKSGFKPAAGGVNQAGCVEIDECAMVKCLNGGTCVDKLSDYMCTCASGFTGRHCETDVDDCAARPCQNGATCVDKVNAYECECSAGYEGANCEANVDDCAGSPCANSGNCKDGIASFTCSCAQGWTGATCMQDIDECAALPCGDHAACENHEGGYTCTCLAGYRRAAGADATCEDINECQSNLDACPAHAVCENTAGSYTCKCRDGYSRDDTSAECRDVDECDVGLDDCDKNADCENLPGTFVCECRPGYAGSGKRCHSCQVTCSSGQFLKGECADDLPPPQCVLCTPCERGLTAVGGCIGGMDTVCADVEVPTITFVGDNPLVIEAGDAYTPAVVSAVDKYDGAITVKVAGEAAISTQRPGTYRVVYTATDAAGNAASYERKVSVVDTTPPRITLAGKATLVLEAGGAYNEPGFSAFDIVDGDMTDALIVTAAPPLPVNTRATGTTTLAYTVTDSTGNTNSASRVVIVQDTTGPALTLRGQTYMQVEGNSAEEATWQDPGVVSVEDAVDGDLLSAVTLTVTVSKAVARMEIPTCPEGFSRLHPELVYAAPQFETASVDLAAPAGTLYEITYRAVDQAGNPTTVQRTVEIIDTRAPMLTVTPGLTLSFDMPRQAGQPLQPNSTSASTGLPVVTGFEQLSITAYDALDGNLAGLVCVAVLRDGLPARSNEEGDEGEEEGDGERRRRRRDVLMGLDPSAPLGTEFAVTLSVTDFAGRTLEQIVSMTVTDTQPPYIDLVGGLVYEAQFGPPFKEPGFRAVDGRDGNLTQGVIVTGEINTRLRSGKDQYLTYTVADDAGNVARVTRVVTLDRGRINLGSTESDSSAGPVGMIAGIILGAVLVLLVLLAVLRRRRRRVQQHKALQAQALAYHGPDNGLGSFTNPAYGWTNANLGNVDRREGQEAQHGMYQPIEAEGQEAERGYLEIAEDHGMDASPNGAMRYNLETSAKGSRSATYDLADQRSQGAAVYDQARGPSSGFGAAYDLASQRSQGAAIYDQACESGSDGSYLAPVTADGGYASIGQRKAATVAVYDRATEGKLDPAYATASSAGLSGKGAFYDIGTSSSSAPVGTYDLAGGHGGEHAYDTAHGAEVPRHYLEARPHRGEGGVYDNIGDGGASAVVQSEAAYDEPSAMLNQRRAAEYDTASGDRESAYDRATGGGSAPPLYAQARRDDSVAVAPVYATARPQRNAGMPAAPGDGLLEDGTYDNVGQEAPETHYAKAARFAEKPSYAEARRGEGPTYDAVRGSQRAFPAYDIGNSHGEPAYDLGQSEDPTYARSARPNGGQAGGGDAVYDVATGSGC